MNNRPATKSINAIADFFEANLLSLYHEAADDACNVFNISPFLSNLTGGVAFWDSSFGRVKQLRDAEEKFKNSILCENNSVLFKLDQCEFRCHRVNPQTGIPQGGGSLKKALQADQHLLMKKFEELPPRGRLLIGFHVDFERGLTFAELSEVHLNIARKGYTKTSLKSLFGKQPDIVKYPDYDQDQKPKKRSSTPLEFIMPVGVHEK